MRRLFLSLFLILFWATSAFAAMSADTCWEMRSSNGNSANGGGFVWVSLVNATYKWTQSTGGTNEFYITLAAGGDPGLTQPTSVTTDGTFKLDTNGVIGSLNAGEWVWGDNDTLGYSTLYVRLDDGADPDGKNPYFVCMGKGGGTDYSQQNAAQLTIADGSAPGAGTTFTSATGGFTAAMIGNIINIVSGTNLTAGRYEITAVANTNTLTTDRACATGAGTGDGVARIGGADTILTDAKMELWIAGNKCFIKNETMTLTGNIGVSISGTVGAYISLIGYNSTRGDTPTGINRPTIICAAYTFTLTNYWSIENLFFTTTAANGLFPSYYPQIINCKVINSSTTTTRDGIVVYWDGLIDKCETISMVGDALQPGNGSKVLNCYTHDSSTGINLGGQDGLQIINNIVSECSLGCAGLTAAVTNNIIGNTIYRSDNLAGSYGISCTGALNPRWLILNNIITGWATGIDWADTDYSIWIDYNDFWSNTIDIEAVLLRRGFGLVDHNIYTNPLLTNPNGTLIEDCEDAWAEYTGTGVTATADGVDYKVGVASARATCTAATGVEVVMTEAITATNMSAYNGIRCWIRTTDAAFVAGDWQLLLDNHANCVSPEVTLPLPTMTANTWYWVYLNSTDLSGATAIISIGLKQAVDEGAMSFYIDGVRGADCDFTVQTGSPVLDTGSQIGTTEGVTGDYKVNIGVDGDDNAAGGGASFFINT